MGETTSAAVRDRFDQAADAFTKVVSQIGPNAWDGPGLGEWTVRDLVGHASRSFVTVETYLAAPAGQGGEPRLLPDAAAYYLAIRETTYADAAAITQRGRDAGAALGDDPAGAVTALATRVTQLVRERGDDDIAVTPFGSLRLAEYLRTRILELTVHTLDMCRATGIPRPAELDNPVRGTLLLCAEVGAALPIAADLLLLLTGRADLPAGLSVV